MLLNMLSFLPYGCSVQHELGCSEIPWWLVHAQRVELNKNDEIWMQRHQGPTGADLRQEVRQWWCNALCKLM